MTTDDQEPRQSAPRPARAQGAASADRERPDPPRQLRRVSRQGAARVRRPQGRHAGRVQHDVAAHSAGRADLPLAAVRPARRQARSSTSAAAPGRSPGTSSSTPTPTRRVTCTDLSRQMLRRARNRLQEPPAAVRRRPTCRNCRSPTRRSTASPAATCWSTCRTPSRGWPRCRACSQPGGRMLLLTTEDNFSGAWTSRLWYCRTYNRAELMRLCEQLGLHWKQELWFTQDAQGDPRRRHLRGDREAVTRARAPSSAIGSCVLQIRRKICRRYIQ